MTSTPQDFDREERESRTADTAAADLRMDAVVQADYRAFADRHYRPLSAAALACIERQRGVGVPLEDIASLLNVWGHAPLARRERAWTGFSVRLALAIAAAPDLRPRLVAPATANAA